MGKKSGKYNNIHLIIILFLLVQAGVLIYFAASGKFIASSDTDSIVAVVGNSEERYLAIQEGEKIISKVLLPSIVHYINYDNGYNHLFDIEKKYIASVVFDEKWVEYEILFDEVAYNDTNFECEVNTCTLKKEVDGSTQLSNFVVSDEVVYIDADIR